MAERVNLEGVNTQRSMSQLRGAISQQLDELHADDSAGQGAAESAGLTGGDSDDDEGEPSPRRKARDESDDVDDSTDDGIQPPPKIAAKPKDGEGDGEGTTKPKPASRDDEPFDLSSIEDITTEERRNQLKKFAPGGKLDNLTRKQFRDISEKADKDYWRIQNESAALARGEVTPPDGSAAAAAAPSKPAAPAAADGPTATQPQPSDDPIPLPSDVKELTPYRAQAQRLIDTGNVTVAKIKGWVDHHNKLNDQTAAIEAKYNSGEVELSAVTDHYRAIRHAEAQIAGWREKFNNDKAAYEDVILRGREVLDRVSLRSDFDKTQEQSRTTQQQQQDAQFATNWNTQILSSAKSMKLFDGELSLEDAGKNQDVVDFAEYAMNRLVTERNTNPDKVIDLAEFMPRVTARYAAMTKRSISEDQRDYAKKKSADTPKAPSSRKALPNSAGRAASRTGGKKDLNVLRNEIMKAEL